MKAKLTMVVTAILLLSATFVNAQTRLRACVLNIDSKGLELDAVSLGNLARLELQKVDKYEIIRKYDVEYALKGKDLDVNTCYSTQCLIEVGKLLRVDKMITGNAERYEEKIVITMHLVDVATGSIEKTNVMEYINLQAEIQNMMGISVKKLIGSEVEQTLVNLLVNYDVPVSSPKTQLKLNGPRVGAAFVTGDMGKRLQEAEATGGFDMYPLLTQIGYQYEIQYLSAGSFQALVEFLGMVSGMEQGSFIPSFVFMNGFRSSRTGLEVAFGPVFRFVKETTGFYDRNGYLGEKDKWYLDEQWYELVAKGPDLQPLPFPTNYENENRMDSRGSPSLNVGWVWAIGKTFKSGYLNIPVNVYVSPRKEGWFVGASFGFNINKTPKAAE